MSLADCIRRAIAGGELDRSRGEEAARTYERMEQDAKQRGSLGDSERVAQADTMKALRIAAAERERRAVLGVRVAQELDRNMAAYKGGKDPSAFMLALMEEPGGAAFSTVSGRHLAIRGRAHGNIDGILATFSRDLAGRTRNKATLRDVVGELFGVNTGNKAAAEFAKSWTDTAEWLRLRFNAAGGHIGKLESWGLPQSHDTLAVRRAPYQEWRDFIMPLLDPAKMIDYETGRALSPQALEAALRQVHDTIRSDGFNKLVPSGGPGGRALANRHAEHRFLIFRGPDEWMNYQARFGRGDPFSAMMGHIDRMSRDIALMEVLGPNPAATMRWLSQTAEKSAVEKDVATGLATDKGQDRARSNIKAAEDAFNWLTGASSAPINGQIARTFAGLRSFLTSMQLGAASLSAISDLGFQRAAARFNGLPQARTVGNLLKLLTPGNVDDRRLAMRLGLVAEHASSTMLAAARYTGEVATANVAARLSDFVLRASGLSPWTQAGRWAFGMNFLGTLADEAGKTFDALDPHLAKALDRYGIGAAGWDAIRTTTPYEFDGARFLRPEDIAARADMPFAEADRLATRVLEMVQGETEFAVPSASVRGRSAFIGAGQPGTVHGELLRSLFMYKNFSVTLAMTHIARGVGAGSAVGTAGYLGSLVISTTILGALALQLKEIAKGRQPRPMDTPAFWGAAMLQGGGLGIFGDFLGSSTSRFGGGLAETVAGPVVGAVSDVLKATVGNVAEAIQGKDTNAASELVGLARRYTPGGSLWYLRLAYERGLLDQLQLWADPDAQQNFRRVERRYQNEYNQQYWWAPGKMVPSRSPILGAP